MAEPQLTVLYVDQSIGFGGSSKSLALTLGGLPEVRPLMVTSQEPELVCQLFGSVKSWQFRRRVNHRTRARLSEWVRHRNPLFRQLVSKGYALLDLVVSVPTLVKLLRIIKRHRVDLVHLNNGFQPREAILAARLSGVPSVVHLRGVVQYPVGHRIRGAAAKVDRTIAVSHATIQHLKEALPDLPVTVIYDPVDVDAMDAAASKRQSVRKKIGAKEGDILVGTFGRVVYWKGQLKFVRACMQAMDVDPRIVAVIVGDASDGSGTYFRKVQEVTSASRHADRFVLTGYQPNVEAYYHAMDIAVHFSITPEPFGMVIPEAMAAARPVIASDAGGPREIITHGEDGLRVPPGDVHALSEAILSLARDPERRRELGRHGKRTVEARFTIEQNANAVRRVYREVLQDTGSPRPTSSSSRTQSRESGG